MVWDKRESWMELCELAALAKTPDSVTVNPAKNAG
jgi:hypothetical protein